jgi:hypothetical protein
MGKEIILAIRKHKILCIFESSSKEGISKFLNENNCDDYIIYDKRMAKMITSYLLR